MFTYERYRDRKAKNYVQVLSKDRVRFDTLEPLMGDIGYSTTEIVLLTEMEDERLRLLNLISDIDALIVDLKAMGA